MAVLHKIVKLVKNGVLMIIHILLLLMLEFIQSAKKMMLALKRVWVCLSKLFNLRARNACAVGIIVKTLAAITSTLNFVVVAWKMLRAMAKKENK
jgi:uncharacterized membrane protein